jgi:hypothetical protein
VKSFPLSFTCSLKFPLPKEPYQVDC